MNTNKEEKAKTSAIKVLAIIGLISVAVLAVWAGIQLVRVIPSAFSSLASVADTVYNNRSTESLTITTGKNIVNTGESFRVSWNDVGQSGEYSFYYTCTAGVSIDMRTGDGHTSSIRCGSPTLIPENDTSFDMIVYSEQRRFVDVPFTVAFTPSATSEAMFERNNKITVVNATIPQSVDVAIENGDDVKEEDMPDDEPVAEDNDTSSEGAAPTAGTPTHTERTVTYYPQSYENGFTDLKITYLGVGIITDGDFTPAGSIDKDERGAMRFEVKNIGTKTSREWMFDATLPTGFVFTSDEQTGLRPNERAVYTLGFDVAGEESGTKDIGATLDVPNETNKNNNSFEWSVKIAN